VNTCHTGRGVGLVGLAGLLGSGCGTWTRNDWLRCAVGYGGNGSEADSLAQVWTGHALDPRWIRQDPMQLGCGATKMSCYPEKQGERLVHRKLHAWK
jgi:hypothetical protein